MCFTQGKLPPGSNGDGRFDDDGEGAGGGGRELLPPGTIDISSMEDDDPMGMKMGDDDEVPQEEQKTGHMNGSRTAKRDRVCFGY